MEERLVERIPLENGLTLELYDKSRRVAGDRWLVHFVARVVIGIEEHFSRDDGAPDLETVKAVLGETIDWSFEKKSHFVDESEKDEEFSKLKDDFIKAGLGYLSGSNFTRRLILSRYTQKVTGRRAWKAA